MSLKYEPLSRQVDKGQGCTLHPAPCTLHPAPYTLDPTHLTEVASEPSSRQVDKADKMKAEIFARGPISCCVGVSVPWVCVHLCGSVFICVGVYAWWCICLCGCVHIVKGGRNTRLRSSHAGRSRVSVSLGCIYLWGGCICGSVFICVGVNLSSTAALMLTG